MSAHSNIKHQVKIKILALLFSKYAEHLTRTSDEFVHLINKETNSSFICYKYLHHKFWSNKLRNIPISRSISTIPPQYIPKAKELLFIIKEYEVTKRIIENYITNALNICKDTTDIVAVFPKEFELSQTPNIGLEIKPYIKAFLASHKKEEKLMKEQYTLTLLL